MTDITRTSNFVQKKSICMMADLLKEGTASGEVAAATDTHLIGYLPPDSVIMDAYIHVKTASDAATSNVGVLGTTDGGTEILSAADLTATGETGTFTGQSLTGSGVPVYLGFTVTGAATNVGEYVVVIEYLEYTKSTGEYTKMSS